MEKRLNSPVPDSLEEIEAEIDFWYEQKQRGAFAPGSNFDERVTARLARLERRVRRLEKSEPASIAQPAIVAATNAVSVALNGRQATFRGEIPRIEGEMNEQGGGHASLASGICVEVFASAIETELRNRSRIARKALNEALRLQEGAISRATIEALKKTLEPVWTQNTEDLSDWYEKRVQRADSESARRRPYRTWHGDALLAVFVDAENRALAALTDSRKRPGEKEVTPQMIAPSSAVESSALRVLNRYAREDEKSARRGTQHSQVSPQSEPRRINETTDGSETGPKHGELEQTASKREAKPLVFICYCKQDRNTAVKIFDFLMEQGADPWLDKRKLVLGDDWEAEIEKAVQEAEAFVVCLSPEFDEIGFRQEEVRWARKALAKRPPGRGFIIPFIIQPCPLPAWCSPFHAGADLSEPSQLADLIPAIEKHCGRPLRPELSPSEGTNRIERWKQELFERRVRSDAFREALDELTTEFLELWGSGDRQGAGCPLDEILRRLLVLSASGPRASFISVSGEQIDGSFSFEGTDYLLEANCQKDPVRASDLDTFEAELSRMLDNTVGLYLSINGFSDDVVKTHSPGRRLVLLMDGSDIMAVLEGRIDLVQLLLRKRRVAAQTGNIYLRIHEVLTEEA